MLGSGIMTEIIGSAPMVISLGSLCDIYTLYCTFSIPWVIIEWTNNLCPVTEFNTWFSTLLIISITVSEISVCSPWTDLSFMAWFWNLAASLVSYNSYVTYKQYCSSNVFPIWYVCRNTIQWKMRSAYILILFSVVCNLKWFLLMYFFSSILKNWVA